MAWPKLDCVCVCVCVRRIALKGSIYRPGLLFPSPRLRGAHYRSRGIGVSKFPSSRVSSTSGCRVKAWPDATIVTYAPGRCPALAVGSILSQGWHALLTPRRDSSSDDNNANS